MTPRDAFISYSSRDERTAAAVCEALETAGIQCWIAPRDIPAGRTWKRDIVEAIRLAKVIVLIYSKESNGSAQVQREIDIAFEAGRPIIPFRIDDVEMGEDLYYCVGSRHWLDAVTEPLEPHLRKLVAAVSELTAPGREGDESVEGLPAAGERPGATAVSSPPATSRHTSEEQPRLRHRRRFLPAALVVGVVAAIGGATLVWADLSRDPTLVLDSWSESVSLVPSDDIDMIAAVRRGASAVQGIQLDPPLVYIRGLDVRVPAISQAVSRPTGDVAVPELLLQHLEVSSDCELQIDVTLDGAVRVGIGQQPTGGDAAADCYVRGQVWSSDVPDMPEWQLLAPWMEISPDQQVELTAAPSLGRPARLEFYPSGPVHLDRIGVRRLAFESREHGPNVESAILRGSIRFPSLANELVPLSARDTVILPELEGELLELALADSIRTVFRGTSSEPRIADRPLRPGLQERLYHSNSFRAVVAVGFVTLAAAALWLRTS